MSSIQVDVQRRLPIGCEMQRNGAHFRVWAPAATQVRVALRSSSRETTIQLTQEPGGYHSGFVEARAGDRYGYLLNADPQVLPDPASRFQPDGPFGWSQIVDIDYPWTDSNWEGVAIRGQVLYEMHIGTFTQEGTFAAAAEQLRVLADCGITVVELMPVADFPGRWGWGYDGVNLFAPSRLYGEPDDLRRFVDTAHACGIGVLLDVVYNHFGPSGNFLNRFSGNFFHAEKATEWGEAINYDGPGSEGVREFFAANAAYWVEEFHFDGLRLDATQDIHDTSKRHILAEIGDAVRKSARGRQTIVIAENEPQHTRLVRPQEDGGYGLDGLWNDDFHHSAVVALTGRTEAYYHDYEGTASELLGALKNGYLYQGQHYAWQKKGRGTPGLALPPHAFVTYLENHDQVANSARGLRMWQRSNPGLWRGMTALLLLGPGTPLLFQGQEFASSKPFLYFADHEELAQVIADGRKEFLSQFRSLSDPGSAGILADPNAEETFRSCVLDLTERESHAPAYTFHRELLRLRRDDPVLSAIERGSFDGAALGPDILLLRFFGRSGNDRLFLLNLGRDWEPRSIAEPLIAPPEGAEWKLLLSTEDVRFGGDGVYEPCKGGNWCIPGQAAVLLEAVSS